MLRGSWFQWICGGKPSTPAIFVFYFYFLANIYWVPAVCQALYSIPRVQRWVTHVLIIKAHSLLGGGDTTIDFVSKEQWSLVKALHSSPAPTRPECPSRPKTHVPYFIHPVSTQVRRVRMAGRACSGSLGPSYIGGLPLIRERRHLTWNWSYAKANHWDLSTESCPGGCSFQVGQSICIYDAFKASLGPYHFRANVALSYGGSQCLVHILKAAFHSSFRCLQHLNPPCWQALQVEMTATASSPRKHPLVINYTHYTWKPNSWQHPI